MAKRYNVKVKVVKQVGHCAAEHKVGDEFFITSKTPGGMCLSAFAALYPTLRVLQFGGTFPWVKDPEVYPGIACPDAENPVVFEMRRVEL
ncbi:MAG: TIGR04076 family protein [Chloroflexi bacterium]|nr:TIGR04076 family protein [Chloroflexota bacterium]